ncbi:uncharacterized protein LOC9646259 [Selaginella moellendorffii]|nr:uncharacterized protein LOC9646259 [Selaginella moellendorffii]|eukprot:XP_002969824.2 uncharacterized protein LOC9646259 [Selaginella moellendorffii]
MPLSFMEVGVEFSVRAKGLSQYSCSNPRHSTLGFGALKADRRVISTRSRNFHARVATGESQVGEVDSKVEESVLVLKAAAKSKKIPGPEVFAAFRVLEKARVDPSNFLETLGGSSGAEPRCWMLVFTSGAKVVREALKGGGGGGTYFPFTAVQQYNATTKSIQNGLYLGPLGVLEFMGRFSWSKNKLFFIFDSLSFKVGRLGPFQFAISKKEELDREPGNKDPFFIWFYADEEIVVGKGRGGGIALWVRCNRRV